MHSKLKLELRLLRAAWPEWETPGLAPWRPTTLIANTVQGRRTREQEEGGRVSDRDYQGGKERAEESRGGVQEWDSPFYILPLMRRLGFQKPLEATASLCPLPMATRSRKG